MSYLHTYSSVAHGRCMSHDPTSIGMFCVRTRRIESIAWQRPNSTPQNKGKGGLVRRAIKGVPWISKIL